MTENNKDVDGTVENNELEMIDEGAPVEPETDPETGAQRDHNKDGE